MTTTTLASRRRFIQLTAGASLYALATRPVRAIAVRSFASNPFSLGVASGDPAPDGFVIWTRLALEPLASTLAEVMPGDSIEVRWEVAEDEAIHKVVARGTTAARASLGHSVHVEVQGLQPGRWYFYRFHAGDATSRVGRTRTAPAIDALPDRLRFAFASCQHFEHGYFTAYQHMLTDDVDLVVHLGDYIYEGAAAKGKPRTHIGQELMSLDDYRRRYAQYRQDEHLQSMHAQCPWIVTWDDHEFDNNCASDISEEKEVSREAFLVRRAAAYQAYYESMPLRVAQLPDGPNLTLYRSCNFGRLAAFQVLDTRQYRSDQPCGDGNKSPCKDVYSPDATVLGTRQEQWLSKQLASSPATWNILAQQIMMARVDRAPGESIAWSMDQWAGYDAPRKRLLKEIADRRVSNPVVLTGDIHSNWVNDLKVDFDDEKSPTVATEFVGTSISSGGDGVDKPKDLDKSLAENPFVKFMNAQRGYVRCEVTPKQWRSDYCVVPNVTKPDGSREVRASFVVEAGRCGATGEPGSLINHQRSVARPGTSQCSRRGCSSAGV